MSLSQSGRIIQQSRRLFLMHRQHTPLTHNERGRLRIIPYLAHTSSATISTILLKILLKIDHSNHSAENSAEKWRADYCLSQLISLPVQSILVLIFPRRTGSGIFSVIFSRFSAGFQHNFLLNLQIFYLWMLKIMLNKV